MLLQGSPGRTDRLPIMVEENSYVIPADVVSGFGQGDTVSGAKILGQVFSSHGSPARMADGGDVTVNGKKVPIVAAGGEYVVPPSVVVSIGSGDAAKGHKILDRMVRESRYNLARRLTKLPGPRRD